MKRVETFPQIYPPRPRGAIPPDTVGRYEGYLAQYKYDDIRLLIHVDRKGKLGLMTRKREPVKSFSVDRALEKQFARIRTRKGFLYLFDGGVLRTAYGPEARHPLILWDVLVHEDQYLLGTKYADRYDLLYGLCGKPKRFESRTGREVALEIGPDLWLARNFRSMLPERFAIAKETSELEGLVLKNPNGVLEWGVTEENNGEWQIRVRKASKRHLM
jgi:ATP-dependent DNA ligase